jgi:hypothetical protein
MLQQCCLECSQCVAAMGPQTVIHDLTGVTTFSVSAEFIHQLAQQKSPLDTPLRVFIVVNNQLAYGLARMFQVESESTMPGLTVVLPQDQAFFASHEHSRFLRVRQTSNRHFAVAPSAEPLAFPNPRAVPGFNPAEPLSAPQPTTYPPTHDDRRAQELMAEIARRRPTAYIPKVGDTVVVSEMPGPQRILSVDHEKQEADVEPLSGHIRFRRGVPWALLSRSRQKRKAKKAAP